MKQRVIRKAALFFILAWCSGAYAAAFRVPANMPVREPGLWLRESTNTVLHQGALLEIKRVWRICLYDQADRALHELALREQEVNAAGYGQSCQMATPVLDGNLLSWTMQCKPLPAAAHTQSTIKSPLTIQYHTTFLSGTQTQSESSITSADQNSGVNNHRIQTSMKRQGECDDTLKPGMMLMEHLLVDGVESLKSRRKSIIRKDVDDAKAYIKFRLEEFEQKQ